MQNKRGDVGISSVVIVVLAVIVLALVSTALFMGWSNFTVWIRPDTVNLAVGVCQRACTEGSKADFCTQRVSFKASRDRFRNIYTQEELTAAKAEYEAKNTSMNNAITKALDKEYTYNSQQEKLARLNSELADLDLEMKDYLETGDNTDTDYLDLVREHNTLVAEKDKVTGDSQSKISLRNLLKVTTLTASNLTKMHTCKDDNEECSSLEYYYPQAVISTTIMPTVLNDLKILYETYVAPYNEAKEKYLNIKQTIDYGRGYTGAVVNKYSCQQLTEHNVWDDYFGETCPGTDLCDSISYEDFEE